MRFLMRSCTEVAQGDPVSAPRARRLASRPAPAPRAGAAAVRAVKALLTRTAPPPEFPHIPHTEGGFPRTARADGVPFRRLEVRGDRFPYMSRTPSPSARVGRPTKLTPEPQERVVRLVRVGVAPYAAARACGVKHRTWYDWLRRARAGEKRYAPLADALAGAHARLQAALTVQVRAAAVENWRAAAWLLERRWPEDWGRRRRSVPEDEPPMAPVPLTGEERARLRRIAARADAASLGAATPADASAKQPHEQGRPECRGVGNPTRASRDDAA